MQSFNSKKWIDAMKDAGVKPIGCKWIFKIKKDSKGNIARYKAHLVIKDFTQKKDIDYKETFSSMSSKDSFRTIMTLMDVKTAFLNGGIDRMIYMVQPENFMLDDSKSMTCKQKEFIYGLKQASHQWYHKFHQVITLYGFETNVVDDCVYDKLSGSKYIFLILGKLLLYWVFRYCSTPKLSGLDVSQPFPPEAGPISGIWAIPARLQAETRPESTLDSVSV
ncbi:hypothetical protein CR513_38409, partial [Mucuna pruriens]